MFKQGDIIKRRADEVDGWFLYQANKDDYFEVLCVSHGDSNPILSTKNLRNGNRNEFYSGCMELVYPVSDNTRQLETIKKIEALMSEITSLLADLKN